MDQGWLVVVVLVLALCALYWDTTGAVMPKGKYKPAASKAQERALFALEARGKLAKGEARGKAHAAKVKATRTGKPVPERVTKRQR